MLEIGKYHELTILRETSVGLFLGNEENANEKVSSIEKSDEEKALEIKEREANDAAILGSLEEIDTSELEEVGLGYGTDDSSNDVLLPNKYCPEKFEIGDKLRVFVYLDFDERRVATNIHPKILLNQFAFLKVVAVSEVGAFLDWGLEKDLMVPFREQRQKMEEGRWYVVYMDIDKKSDRLFASNRIDRYLNNENLSVKEGDEVDLLITQQSDIGYSVIVNQLHKGLIFKDEVYKDLNVGSKLKGYVKKIRTDNKIDISLQAIGYDNYNDSNTDLIFKALVASDGFINLNDKSSPEEISMRFAMSKKAFKKSIGSLYKQRKISMDESGIRLVE